MKKNTLDMSLKKFKHVRSTPDATTLQHQDGHILTIAHKNLDPSTKAQLQALSKIPSESSTPAQANEQRDQKMADGGIAQDVEQLAPMAAKLAPMLMADGGEPKQTAYDQAKEMLLGPDWSDPKINPNHVPVYAGAGPMAGIAGAAEALAPAAEEAGEAVAGSLQGAGKGIGTQRIGNTTVRPDRGFGKTIVTDNPPQKLGSVSTPDMPSKTTSISKPTRSYGSGMAEGGPVKMADGGLPTADDAGPTPMMNQNPEDARADEFKRHGGFNPAPPEPQIDPKVQAMRDRYDQLVGNPEMTFKVSKGQAPLNFQPNLAAAANEDVTKQLAANDAAKTAQNSAQIQKNAALAQMGLPPNPGDPSTIASANPQPQGTTANPAPQYAGQLPNLGPDGKQASPDQQGIPSDIQNAYNVGMAGIGAQERANTAMAGAIGEKGVAEQAVANKAADAENTVRDHFQTEFKNAETELQSQIKDYKEGQIDPEAFWHGIKNPQTGQMEGGHSKLLAGIGMILGGFNATDRPNAGIEMINHRIEQNINAQMTNLNAKHNIVRANLDHYHDLNTALDMSRLMLNQSAQHSLQAVASQFAGPIAKQQYAALNGQLEQSKAQLMQQYAMTKTMFNLGNNVKPDGTKAAMSPDDQIASYTSGIKFLRASGQLDKAKDLESHVVPGVGISPNQTPSEAQKALLTGHRVVNQMFNDSLEFSEKYGGKHWLDYNPAQRVQLMQQGRTIQAQLIGAVKQAQHDGVYKDSEAKFLLDQIGGDPGSFVANFSSVPGIKEMQTLKSQEYSQQAKSLGIDNFKPLEQYNAVVYHKGIPVRKGPDGNYHRVK